MRILLLQNHDNSGPGYLDEPAVRRGVRFEACMPHLNAEHRLPADGSGYDGFLLMGGAMHAGHVEEHPWLEDAAALVRHFTEAEKPVLGICLGSQIVARAFGARCYDMPVPEVGFVPIALTQAAASDPLLGQSFDNPLHLAQFHSQTFDIPEGATRLMVGEEGAEPGVPDGSRDLLLPASFRGDAGDDDDLGLDLGRDRSHPLSDAARGSAAPAAAPPLRLARLLLPRGRGLARPRRGAGEAGRVGQERWLPLRDRTCRLN